MSHQLTNEEQFIEIKAFFVSTWKIIVAVIVIGLLAIWGWRYWQNHQTDKVMMASEKYEQLIAKLDNNVVTSVDELVAFAQDNDTIYSVFANLRAARFYVEALKDYAGAQALLNEALNKNQAESIASIIHIQIAHLQYQLAQYQASLSTLDKIVDKDWAAMANDIRGDVFVKLMQYNDAINAYHVAQVSFPTPELAKNLKMKLNEAQYLQNKIDTHLKIK